MPLSNWSAPSLQFDSQNAVGAESERADTRRHALRLVEYSNFPRMDLDAGLQTGLALNESDSGICIAVKDEEEIGALLRITVRGIDGLPVRDVVARVVWCRDADEGRYRVGLEMMRETKPRMMRVRHEQGRRRVSLGE
jgi:hypothetical protein